MKNTEIILNLYEAFARRDVEAIMKLTDEEIAVTQTDLLPWGGEFHGHEGLQTFFGKLLANIDSQVEPQEFIEAGNRVVVLGRTRGTVRKNGKSFDVRICHVWKIRSGKGARFEAYIDTPQMLEALD